MKKFDDIIDIDLLKMIEKIGKEQYFRLDRLEITKYNHLFEKLHHCVDELKSRSGDRRILLREHYTHPNLQVRLNAAIHTLAVAPQEARAQLQAIRDRQRFPQAMYASSCLESLASGFFVPK